MARRHYHDTRRRLDGIPTTTGTKANNLLGSFRFHSRPRHTQGERERANFISLMKGESWASRRFCPLSSSQPGTLSLSNAIHLASKPNTTSYSSTSSTFFLQYSDPFVPLTGRKADRGSFPTVPSLFPHHRLLALAPHR